MSRSQSNDKGEAPASQHVRPNRGSKVTWAMLVLCALLAAALIVIYRLSFLNLKTNKCLQMLKEENEALRKPFTDNTFLTCEEGWEPYGGQCYNFSTNKSAWNESGDECRAKGGDLVKIDSREEQMFLERRLTDIMMDKEDKFWIGLTDSETEGTWLWVDGSALDTSLTFWNPKEPNNWIKEDPDGEDCGRMGEKGGRDLKCWFDKSCKLPHRSICEKPVGTQTICV